MFYYLTCSIHFNNSCLFFTLSRLCMCKSWANSNYCPGGQATLSPSSYQCPKGFYCPEGSDEPTICERGIYFTVRFTCSL